MTGRSELKTSLMSLRTNMANNTRMKLKKLSGRRILGTITGGYTSVGEHAKSEGGGGLKCTAIRD